VASAFKGKKAERGTQVNSVVGTIPTRGKERNGNFNTSNARIEKKNEKKEEAVG